MYEDRVRNLTTGGEAPTGSGRQQFSTPPAYVAPADANAADDVFNWAARQPEHVMFVS